MGQMAAPQHGGRGRLRQRGRVDEAGVIGRCKDRPWFAGRRRDGGWRGGRRQVHHPAVPAEQHAVGIRLAHLGQALRRERRDPRIQPVRTEIECASQQLLEPGSLERLQVRQAGAEIAQRLQGRFPAHVRVAGGSEAEQIVPKLHRPRDARHADILAHLPPDGWRHLSLLQIHQLRLVAQRGRQHSTVA